MATVVDISRMLQTTQEWVLEHLADVALKLPGGELRWDWERVFTNLLLGAAVHGWVRS